MDAGVIICGLGVIWLIKFKQEEEEKEKTFQLFKGILQRFINPSYITVKPKWKK